MIALRFLQNRVVGPQDIGQAYTLVAETYHQWTLAMEKVNREVVSAAAHVLPPGHQELKLLDLTCGPGNWSRLLREELDTLGRSNFRVTGVDVSQGMITSANRDNTDQRISFENAEALKYLQSLPSRSLDGILCGWGLVYLPQRKVLKEVQRVLKPGGIAGFLMNRRGTLGPIEEIFLQIMAQKPLSIAKIMVTRFQLPSGLRAFLRWFARWGLHPCHSGQGEVIRTFHTPDDLVSWLTTTGVLAGTEYLMDDPSWKESFRRQVTIKLQTSEGFSITHAYVYGIFRKEN